MCQFSGEGKQDLPGLGWPWDSSSWVSGPARGRGVVTWPGMAGALVPLRALVVLAKPSAETEGSGGTSALGTLPVPQPPSEQEGGYGLRQPSARSAARAEAEKCHFVLSWITLRHPGIHSVPAASLAPELVSASEVKHCATRWSQSPRQQRGVGTLSRQGLRGWWAWEAEDRGREDESTAGPERGRDSRPQPKVDLFGLESLP